MAAELDALALTWCSAQGHPDDVVWLLRAVDDPEHLRHVAGFLAAGLAWELHYYRDHG